REDDDCLVVKLDSGRALGKRLAVVDGRDVLAFLGIPFARPPLGRLRFAKPTCVRPWKHVFNATYKRFPCVQSDFSGPKNFTIDSSNSTEDCLHVNVWVPRRCLYKSAMLPVMVFFYGGSFSSGANSYDFYDGRFVSALGNVILVVPNYRLNVFGFLNALNPEAPGNMGLHDQILALKWVGANIAKFGGNPHNIVPFGQSAGAISVTLQMLSPRLSQYAYSRYIVMSAAAYSPLPSNTRFQAADNFRNLAKHLGCTAGSPKDKIGCLQKVDAKEIMKVVNDKKMFFMPSYYDDVLPDYPAAMLRRYLRPANKELLIGVTRNEGVAFFELLFLDYLRKNFTLDAALLKAEFPDVFSGVGESIINFGLSVLSIVYDVNSPTYDGLKDLIGDTIFTCPVQHFGLRFAEMGGRVHYYVYVPKPSFTVFGGDTATHGDDLLVLFGIPFLYPSMATDEDRDNSRRLIEIWTKFARSG
ncbi:unnamed protein product, partial [Ixodes hexagonus]